MTPRLMIGASPAPPSWDEAYMALVQPATGDMDAGSRDDDDAALPPGATDNDEGLDEDISECIWASGRAGTV